MNHENEDARCGLGRVAARRRRACAGQVVFRIARAPDRAHRAGHRAARIQAQRPPGPGRRNDGGLPRHDGRRNDGRKPAERPVALARQETVIAMGLLIRAGWQAVRRRLVSRPSSASVCEALRGKAGVGTVEAVEVSAAETGGSLVTVRLRVDDGSDAREVAGRAAEILHERLPAVQIRVLVLGMSAE